MKKTLGQVFAELRENSGLSLLAIGSKCGLAEATVWKLENDRPVRWETAHLILTVALKIKPGNPVYQNLNQLWLKQRQEKAEALPPESGSKTLSKHAVEASRRFRNLIRDLDPASTKKVLAAATRAASGLKAV
jgi:transcriptional regulator with XRE-family HTH domain